MRFLNCLLLIVFPCLFFCIEEKPLTVVVPSYNNIKWYKRNLNSILYQQYRNYRVIYIDDCSTDGTGDAVEQWLREKNIDHRIMYFNDFLTTDISDANRLFVELINENKVFFVLVHNMQRQGAMANLYRAGQSCEDEEIIVTIDGDDRLAHTGVFQELNLSYSSGDVWYTHGNLGEDPTGIIGWCEPIPESVIQNHTYRSFKCPSHLRTYYAWLFKKINLEDFLYEGKFFEITADMAIMFPIAEMAAERHGFIKSLNYFYNMKNSINDNKVNRQLQNDMDAYIRNKIPYERLNFE